MPDFKRTIATAKLPTASKATRTSTAVSGMRTGPFGGPMRSGMDGLPHDPRERGTREAIRQNLVVRRLGPPFQCPVSIPHGADPSVSGRSIYCFRPGVASGRRAGIAVIMRAFGASHNRI